MHTRALAMALDAAPGAPPRSAADTRCARARASLLIALRTCFSDTFFLSSAQVVDYDYRGAVGVILFNHGEADFPVAKGDRVAQLILERILTPDVVEVDDLDDTARGAGGFGSTGVAGAAK